MEYEGSPHALLVALLVEAIASFVSGSRGVCSWTHVAHVGDACRTPHLPKPKQANAIVVYENVQRKEVATLSKPRTLSSMSSSR